MAEPAVAFAVAALAVLAMGPAGIARLARLKGQQVNPDAPSSHQQKQGTPTMGGLLILAGVGVGAWCGGGSDTVPLLIVFGAYGAVGFLDDWLSMSRGKNLGLKARHKSTLQAVLALAFMACLIQGYGASSAGWSRQMAWSLAPGPWGPVQLPAIAFLLLGALLIVSLSNAVNLTDGVDGLAAGTCAICGGAIALAASAAGHPAAAAAAAALSGACTGFLWFNSHPAQVFMGDTGALALGALLAAIGLSAGIESRLLLACAIFLAEMFSVIIQVAWFKRTRRRIFKMSPLHHHFELSGWKEPQIVARFMVVGTLAAAVALMGRL